MQPKDREPFFRTLGNVLSFYKQENNEFVMGVWWESLKVYDLAAVQQAFNRHAVNPDSGQFPPKPADIVRMMGGTSGDAALAAWSKVERAARSIGQYVSVIFDDALIHRVIEDMGGWVKICSCPREEDFVFVGKEFQNRYRGFAMRSERPPYPGALIGLAHATNERLGVLASLEYRMVGDADKCQAVYRNADGSGGLQTALLKVSQALPLLAGPGA